MFCKHCGKQVSDDSTFCQHCGKKIGISETDFDQTDYWERLTMVIHYRKGEGGWVLQDKYPAPLAQQNFWNEALPIIQEIETTMADEGWQAVGEHGPSCVELESYKSAQGKNVLAETLGAVATYGASLLFAKTWKFTVKSITLKWRRPTKEEVTKEEEFHLWFNSQNKEFERWEIDTATNRWFPMEMDKDGNWTRKQQPPIIQQQPSRPQSPATTNPIVGDHECPKCGLINKGRIYCYQCGTKL